MADDATPEQLQHTIEMPNGVVLSGMGGDPEELRIQFEDRADERAPEPPAASEPVAAAPVEPPAVDKRTRGQKRFDELTQKAEEAVRRADAAEAKTKELEAKLNAPPQPPPAREEPKAQVPPQSANGASAEPTRQKPTEAEVGVKYATYADFIEDLADWKSEQREIKLRHDLDAQSTQRIEADRASRSQADLATQAVARGRVVYPDFDAVLDTVADILIPPSHQAAIMSMPNFEHAMYGLAKDRATLQAFLKIQNPVQAGLELAKFIPSAAVASPASTAPVVRPTNAPAPVQPVGASTRTTSPSSAELADHGDDFDSSGYREKRARELGRKPVR